MPQLEITNDELSTLAEYDVARPILHIDYADNQGLVLLNGSQIFHRKTEGNPKLNWKRDLTEDLATGRNVLVLASGNRNGPAHFVAWLTDADTGNVVRRFEGHVHHPKTTWGIWFWDSMIIRKD